MVIIDDFIPKSYQEDIKNTFLKQLSWNYIPDVTFSNLAKENEQAPAVGHMFRMSQNTLSAYFSMLLPLAYKAADHVGYTFNDVVNCRSFLQFPLNPDFLGLQTDPCHVDLNRDHLVLLYYVLDSDGDTIIIDKKLDVSNVKEFDVHVKDHNVLAKISPKQGRAVIFDGRYYHTAEQPKSNMRCVINYNII